ncbi:MAG: spore coat protein CotJB [Clostridia bacterium]|nr:spore coat protein CotJB [Clostridia bacterium]
MSEQQTLQRRICRLNFAVTDAGLYLDTHPECKNGLAYFRKQQTALNAAMREYEQKFGPLTLAGQSDDARWNWIDSPWPWEGKE